MPKNCEKCNSFSEETITFSVGSQGETSPLQRINNLIQDTLSSPAESFDGSGNSEDYQGECFSGQKSNLSPKKVKGEQISGSVPYFLSLRSDFNHRVQNDEYQEEGADFFGGPLDENMMDVSFLQATDEIEEIQGGEGFSSGASIINNQDMLRFTGYEKYNFPVFSPPISELSFIYPPERTILEFENSALYRSGFAYGQAIGFIENNNNRCVSSWLASHKILVTSQLCPVREQSTRQGKFLMTKDKIKVKFGQYYPDLLLILSFNSAQFEKRAKDQFTSEPKESTLYVMKRLLSMGIHWSNFLAPTNSGTNVVKESFSFDFSTIGGRASKDEDSVLYKVEPKKIVVFTPTRKVLDRFDVFPEQWRKEEVLEFFPSYVWNFIPIDPPNPKIPWEENLSVGGSTFFESTPRAKNDKEPLYLLGMDRAKMSNSRTVTLSPGVKLTSSIN